MLWFACYSRGCPLSVKDLSSCFVSESTQKIIRGNFWISAACWHFQNTATSLNSSLASLLKLPWMHRRLVANRTVYSRDHSSPGPFTAHQTLVENILLITILFMTLSKSLTTSNFLHITFSDNSGRGGGGISCSCSLLCSLIPLFPRIAAPFFFSSTKRYLQVLVNPRSIVKPKASGPEGEI